MTLALGILLIALVAVFVAQPFFSPIATGDTAAEAPPIDPDQWERQKVEAYSAIKEAEFDYRMGKLTDADYQAQRDKYAARALEAIAVTEQAKVKLTPVSGRHAGRVAFCPTCGHKTPKQAKFCPGCGRSFADLRAA